MSDQGSTPEAGSGDAAGGAQGQVMLERLYLKDASFESPQSPSVFTEAWKPEFNLDINTRTSSLGDDRYEVVLSATLRAKLDEERVAYIAEIQQAGIFRVSGLESAQRNRVLGVLCPSTLFPYVRETVDSVVVKGGFPAVHLAPVNFEALYAQAMRQQDEETGPQH
ncbi:MAG: protein-export chaperone SecB [Pseudomonadota bacterium]